MPLIAAPPYTDTPERRRCQRSLSVGSAGQRERRRLRGARELEELVGVASSVDILVFVTQGSCPYLEG